MKKQISFLIIFIITLSFIITIWKDTSFTLITFWNTMFACSLILTIIGASMHILSSGFFQTYVHQFKKIFSQFSKSGQLANQLERKDEFSNLPFFEFSLIAAITITGIMLTIISIVFSIVLIY